jgi:hypothetical protein
MPSPWQSILELNKLLGNVLKSFNHKNFQNVQPGSSFSTSQREAPLIISSPERNYLHEILTPHFPIHQLL